MNKTKKISRQRKRATKDNNRKKKHKALLAQRKKRQIDAFRKKYLTKKKMTFWFRVKIFFYNLRPKKILARIILLWRNFRCSIGHHYWSRTPIRNNQPSMICYHCGKKSGDLWKTETNKL